MSLIKDNLSITGSRYYDKIDESDKKSLTVDENASQFNVLPSYHPNSELAKTVKYWKQPNLGQPNAELIIIHVCDENRNVTRDFNCKRDILVSNMKYFKSFLSNVDSSLNDVDISVHCDVEIFEWLMLFIHETHDPPKLEKSIVVSILISSEFLQMDPLVELCLQFISVNLNEIIKLPIDLSCISEKLLNKLTILTPPNVLATTKDKKDKILNKLYKRRVEIDFSRKATTKNGPRSIASHLTCCKYCGFVYLENFDEYLICKESPPFIDHRGKLLHRHFSIPNWSLTSYLKTLHSGGMNWEAIYWHVWAACQVFRTNYVSISALETDKYDLEDDGVLINIKKTEKVLEVNKSGFSLEWDDEIFDTDIDIKLLASIPEDSTTTTSSNIGSSSQTFIESLNPNRSHGILSVSVFNLLKSQIKIIAGLAHKHLIEATGKSIAKASQTPSSSISYGYNEIIWGEAEGGLISENKLSRGRTLTLGANHTQPQFRGVSLDSIKSDSGSDNEKTQSNSLRSRSTSHGASRRPKKVLTQKKNLGVDDLAYLQGNNYIYNLEGEIDSDKTARLNILKSLSPMLSKLVCSRNGAINGVWINPHPIQLHPSSFWNSYLAIDENVQLSDSKKLEWKMDLLREYDEKRMYKFETFAINKRYEYASEIQPKLASLKKYNNQSSSNINSMASSNVKYVKGEFYKDKSRQSYKSSQFL